MVKAELTWAQRQRKNGSTLLQLRHFADQFPSPHFMMTHLEDIAYCEEACPGIWRASNRCAPWSFLPSLHSALSSFLIHVSATARTGWARKRKAPLSIWKKEFRGKSESPDYFWSSGDLRIPFQRDLDINLKTFRKILLVLSCQVLVSTHSFQLCLTHADLHQNHWTRCNNHYVILELPASKRSHVPILWHYRIMKHKANSTY